MNRYLLSKAGINCNEGISRFSGKIELYEHALYQFPSDSHFQLMCDAIKAGNVKEAFDAAHALKGVSGNLSMNRFHEDLCKLVEGLREGNVEDVDLILTEVLNCKSRCNPSDFN